MHAATVRALRAPGIRVSRARGSVGTGRSGRAAMVRTLTSRPRMPRRTVALIVNPHAGGGRAARLLPGVEAALRAHGVAFHVAAHAVARARARARARGAATPARSWPRSAATGCSAPSRASCAAAGTLARGARRARQRLRPQARHRRRPRRRLRRASRPAHERTVDVAEVDGAPTSGSPAPGFDSDVQRDRATTRALTLGSLVYAYGALRALRAWRPARWDGRRSTASRARSTGTRSPSPTPGVFGGGMYLVPDAELDDGLLDVVLIATHAQAPLPRQPAEGLQGHARARARRCTSCAAARSRFDADRPFTALRRRRPDRRAARRRSASLPGALRVLAPGTAMMLGAQARGRAQGGRRARAPRRAAAAGPSLPGKVLMRLEPHAIGMLAGRLRARLAVDLGHQRQDHDRGDGRRRSSSARGVRLVHNRAGANMAGGVATALAAAARRGGRELDGDLGLFEVDEFWLGPVVAELEPRALLLAQPLPRPARPLRRARDDRRPLGGGRRRAARPHRARAQRRRPARRRPRPRRAEPVYFGVEDDRWRWPSSSTPPTPSTAAAAAHAYVYDAVYLGHLGHYHCPNCGRSRPEPAVAATRRASSTASAAPRSRCAAPAGEARVELPLPGLYNVYNALGAAALCLQLGVPLDGRRRRPAAPSRPRSGAPRRSTWRGRPAVDPARQEPGRRQRGAAHARARGRRARPARRAQRPHRRRPRRLLGLGRRLGAAGAARAAHDVRRHARRRARAAPEVRGRASRDACTWSTRCPTGARRGARRAATGRSTSCPPTPRCSSCATCSPSAARPRSTGDDPPAPEQRRRHAADAAAPAIVIWHDVECGALRRRPAAVARARARGRRADARRRRRHRPRRAAPRRAPGHAVTALDLEPHLLAALAERAPRGRARRWPRSRRRRRLRPRRAALRAGRRADADDPAARADARRASSPRRRATCSPAGCVAIAIADALEGYDEGVELPLPDLGDRDGWRFVSQPVAVRARRGRRPDRARAPGRVARPRALAPSPTRSCSATLDAAGARGRGARGRPASPSRRATSPRPTSTSARRWWSSVPERTLRVCALYPDLMNIYADRGNLLMLERRCDWRGHRLRAGGRRARRRRSTPTRTTSSTSAAARTATRRCARRTSPTVKRDALHAAARARRGRLRGVRRLPAARALLRARRRDAAGRRASSTCARCASPASA